MITVAIQAGGRSSRMGQDKGLVPLASKPMIEHVVTRVGSLGDEVLLTTNNPEGYGYLGLKMVGDTRPGAGALPGLYTALSAATGDFVLVVACDMPFLNTPLLSHQLASANQVDVVVPRWEDRFQTMHAVYRRETCLRAVAIALQQGQKRMISFYGSVRVEVVEEEMVRGFDPAGRTFFNVNTPEELKLAEEIIRDA